MKSAKPGKTTSDVEVSHISPQGFWLLISGREYFLNFQDYPWFQNATIRDIHTVRLHRGHHLEWPTLDVDLELDSITSPERYPLSARQPRAAAKKRG